MKMALAVLSLFISISASADSACTALNSVVGTYEPVSKECDGRFGDDVKDLVVKSESGQISIWVGNVGIGPSTGVNSSDKCTVEAGRIVVQTCYNSTTCLPQHWYYTFTEGAAEYQANGCHFQFKKFN
jgi:hypothetical protein